MKLTKLIPICLAITLSMKWPAITSNLFDPKLELVLEKPDQQDYGRFLVNKSRTKIPAAELKNKEPYPTSTAVESFAAQAGEWVYFITQGYSIFRMSSDGQKTELFLIEEVEAGNHTPSRPSIRDLHIWGSYLYFKNDTKKILRIDLNGEHIMEICDYTSPEYCVVDDYIFIERGSGIARGDLEGKEWKLIWEEPEHSRGTYYELIAAGNNRVLVWESNEKSDILWQMDYNGENQKKVHEFLEMDMVKSGAQLSQDVLYLLRERAYEYTESALRAEWPSEIEEKEQLRKQRSKMEDSIIEAIDLKTGNYQKLLGVWDTEIRDIAVRGENIYYQQRVKIYKSDDIYDYDVRIQIWKLDKNGKIHFVTDVIKAGVNYYATDRYLITNGNWTGDLDTSRQKSAVIRIAVEGEITQPQPEYYKWEYADEIWKDGFPQWVPWK